MYWHLYPVVVQVGYIIVLDQKHFVGKCSDYSLLLGERRTCECHGKGIESVDLRKQCNWNVLLVTL